MYQAAREAPPSPSLHSQTLAASGCQRLFFKKLV
jgi:hypothetical protein